MPRSQGTVPRHARNKKILKASKGSRGGRRRLLRTAKENVLRSLAFAYRDRRNRKRSMRRLWIQRINAAARMHGLSYNQFISGLKKSEITIDRKQLSELAIQDAAAFGKLIEEAKAHLDAPASGATRDSS
ncbi:MAG: 50S ribosomal protein L20 [Candidatus Eisenbacteria bacterium]|nr:50S ribosomal protein L20 [Candidatus Latescibacterota bacterium]MBD3302982.1 50S ribosomal protein L20 [Candidatus Eisenbacteria bacterium]